jgi:hypothetical protein
MTRASGGAEKIRKSLMNDDLRHRLKVERERLADLEEQHAHAIHRAIAGDAEASAERARLADEIEAQKLAISELEGATA